jgi:hypothetical protein
MTSQEYTDAFNEVKSLGALNSSTRTAEQTETALFWAYDRPGMGPPPVIYNQSVSDIATQQGNDLVDNARLFAMTMMAQADAGVAAWDSKYVDNYWRPIAAIREADTDGNPLTEADPNWVPLGAPGDETIADFTPPFPAYVSGHATFGAAVFSTLAQFYGGDEMHFTLSSGELPGVTRSFDSFSQAAAENARSRIYMGIHWNFDDTEGRLLGGKIADWVSENYFSVIPLLAGDADMDLDFDQLDLVQVQLSGKYLTGQPATWGEGDWNGAPGGSRGNPPQGDGISDQLDIIAALRPGHFLTGSYAAVLTDGKPGDSQTSVGYSAVTGEVWVDAPAGKELTSINIDSTASIFTGAAAQNLGGSFDNDADANIFKATFGSSFASINFGPVARSGLSRDVVLGDLTVVGSLAGGGSLGNVDLIYVPEPSTIVLAVIALIFVCCLQFSGSIYSRALSDTSSSH